MRFLDYERLFDTITELVMHHSPSGMETEVDGLILQKFAALGREDWLAEAGAIAITVRLCKCFTHPIPNLKEAILLPKKEIDLYLN